MTAPDTTPGYRARLSAIDKTVHLAQVKARIEREALTAEMARAIADVRRTIGWSAARAASKLTASVEHYMTLEDGTGEPSQLLEAYDLLHACWEARTRQDPPYDARQNRAVSGFVAVPREVPAPLPGQAPRAETRAGGEAADDA